MLDSWTPSTTPWIVALLALCAAVTVAVLRSSDKRLRIGFGITATIVGVLGAFTWPSLAARAINPRTVDLVRLCGDAIGREHITDLKVRTSTFPPAILCFPSGWQSEPIVATPAQTGTLTVILVGLLACILVGVICLIRRADNRTDITPSR